MLTTKMSGQLKPYVWFYLGSMFFLSIARLAIAWLHQERVPDMHTLVYVMALGLRMDTIILCMVMAIPISLSYLLPPLMTSKGGFQLTIRLYLSGWAALIVLMELATPTYIDFFDSRPGRIFFEYLNHLSEVSSMLLGGFLLESILITTGTLIAAIGTFMLLKRVQAAAGYSSYLRQLLLLPLIVATLLLGARSTLGHRPINASSVAFSNDQLLNELALSSVYTVLNAIYALKNEGDPSKLYPQMADTEVFRRVVQDSFIEKSDFDDPDQPTMHRFGTHRPQAKKNLVILLQESMGARFIGKLGGLPLSPRIDRLADEGLWFTQLYATGIRSARGIEAVVTGFPPSASRSVLKLGLAQRGFYTLAQSLKASGYHNYFIYGGESHFDNMRGFLLNNGFDVAIDEKDFSDWKFKGSWGVSDEDLFDKAHCIFEEEEKPFFALVFSSSFHSPFEFPDNRIELYDSQKNTRNNAVKYADFAVGHFFDMARKSSYWDDTIFLVVADHDERPRGASLVPVSSYHIPGLILGKGITPEIYTSVTSQMDLLPTLLPLMGINGRAPFVGQNIRQRPPGYPGRAIMQFGNNHAYMRGDQVVIHRPGKDALQFSYREKELLPVTLDTELQKDALAMALVPGLLYKKQLYQVELTDFE